MRTAVMELLLVPVAPVTPVQLALPVLVVVRVVT